MSNPYIRPNDPRFQREPVVDEHGINRFADPVEAQPIDAELSPDEPIAAQPADSPNAAAHPMYASPQLSATPAYQPEYVSGQPSRQRLILSIGGSALVAAASAAVSWAVDSDWRMLLIPICLILAGTGWYLAADELSVIRKGGLDARFRPITRLGLAMNIVAALVGVGFLAVEVNTLFEVLR